MNEDIIAVDRSLEDIWVRDDENKDVYWLNTESVSESKTTDNNIYFADSKDVINELAAIKTSGVSILATARSMQYYNKIM